MFIYRKRKFLGGFPLFFDLFCLFLDLFHFRLVRIDPYLYTGVTAQVEVELCRMSDAHVDGGSGGDVTALADLILLVGAEQSRVVALLYDDECDSRLISYLQLHTRFSHSSQFMRKYLQYKTIPR